MKSLMLSIIFLFFVSNLLAQEKMEDLVYLKNGSIIRGIIIEQVFNESIKIQCKDGNIYVYKIDEIIKTTKEPVQNEPVQIDKNTTLAITSHSIAQEQRNVIAINPLGIAILGIENVEFERVLNENSGIAFYWARSGVAYAEVSDVGFIGSEQRVSYRYYWAGSAPKRSWAGASFAYSTGDVWDVHSRQYVYDISMLALSIESGYRWMWGNFNIAPIAMLRLPLTDNLLGTKRTSGDVKTPLAGFGLGINIGWGW